MGPSAEDRILAHVLEMSTAIGELTQQIGLLQHHVETLGHSVIAIRDTHTAIDLRMGDHTVRLSRLENSHVTHAGWRSRMGGIIVGVMTTLALLASALAIWKSMTGH